MVDELVKAHLNLYAVMQNMEELVAHDRETIDIARSWDISIQFSVRNGPAGFLAFQNGSCRFGRGQHPSPSVRLFFTSPAHFNRMIDGNGNPIPLKGLTRLGFLTKEFPKATDRLEYFLTPTDELLADPDYLALNTRMTLNTAAFAVVELARYDRIGRLNAAHIMDGGVLMKILPDGPAAHIVFENGRATAGKATLEKPMACMFMKDMITANRFLNGKLDAFTAIAGGDVMIRGQTPMLDAMSNILDRIPLYLS